MRILYFSSLNKNKFIQKKSGGSRSRSFVQPKVRSTPTFQTSPTRKRAVFLWRKYVATKQLWTKLAHQMWQFIFFFPIESNKREFNFLYNVLDLFKSIEKAECQFSRSYRCNKCYLKSKLTRFHNIKKTPEKIFCWRFQTKRYYYCVKILLSHFKNG